MNLRITYFVNQYPKVSHSFIRREIMALERLGFSVQRVALRGWDEKVTDKDDIAEQGNTTHLLKGGLLPLLAAFVRTAVTAPLLFAKAVQLAFGMSHRSERPFVYHLVYLAEACLLLGHLRRFGSQHVHAHFGTNSTEVVMLAHALGGPGFSFTVHGPEEFDKPQFIGLAEKIKRSAFVVAISSFGRSQLFRWIDYTQWPKVHVVHCGLEESFHALAPSQPPDIPRLVCVGRLCEQKGQLLLVQAMALLAQRGIRFDLVLAGDGEMRPEIEALIDRSGLRQQVRITGWISSDQVRNELLAARAMVLPSFAEGLPVVIMEAMALRRPVLTTSIAGVPELVRHGESGWLFAAGSVEELAEAIAACLSTPVEVLHAMGARAYERVLQRHSVDTEAAKLAALFQQAIRQAV
ncbi:colanic acid biosynthesis glycosyltransferase WcaL [Rhodoferax lacus]|uniref:Colanic acid biosynthesis glycosyltransferase WcaL n=1 Tax=Rhodoferax lacus TaxID=2184758 RepID=A0A3E1RF42_9BURK|nr:glycosyltransferase [Rhodoferax lacus]RFO97996.1 colanic acid biosynthesis glycosyltransferase WcaL [Rhodoferax lacus]